VNLRILKKLSKRAAPLLLKLGDEQEQFRAEKGENYHGAALPHPHPLKGTMMAGGMSGYYEPEWSEECAWMALREQVYWHFTKYNEKTEDLEPTRELRLPSQIFRAAEEMIAADLRRS
jgi:hypothetical protein